MSDFTDRISKLLEENHLKRIDLVRATGIGESAIRRWINSDSCPSAETALKVAKYFGVTVEWLVTGEDNGQNTGLVLSEQEMELVETFRHLDDRDKSAVITMANTLEQQYCTSAEKKLGSG